MHRSGRCNRRVRRQGRYEKVTAACPGITKVYDRDLCTATTQLRASELVLPARLRCEVSGNGRWHAYDRKSTGTLGELLAEVDADPTAIFWG